MKFRAQSILALLLTGLGLQSTQSRGMEYLADHKAAAILTASAVALGLGGYYVAKEAHEKSIHWDWQNEVDVNSINGKPITQFFKEEAQKISQLNEPQRKDAPQNTWLWGSATSAIQVDGKNPNSMWRLFEGKQLEGQTVQPAGKASDSLNHIDEDVEKMAAFGLNAYRFSIEWSNVFLDPNTINWEYVDQVRYLIKRLKEKNIKPCVTLYHYSEPIWFYEMGGFEKHENIKYFVDFARFLFEQFGDDVYLWFTFNSPDGVAATGWLTGTKPPAKKDMKLMARVLFNILEAHVQVYKTIKAMPNGNKARVGILKNIMQLDPWNYANPLDHLARYFGNEVVDECIYRYFTTGVFSINVPRGIKTTHIWGIPLVGLDYAMAPEKSEFFEPGEQVYDFIGLNYYCHNYMNNFKVMREPNQNIEIHTNNDRYTIYGEGLYRALKTVWKRLAQPFNVPIYVTENGIGTDNDEHRILQSQRYLRSLAQARAEGVDVRGYMHWSWVDNWEWPGRFDKHYGLNAMKPGTLERIEKPGAAYYKYVVQNSRPSRRIFDAPQDEREKNKSARAEPVEAFLTL